MIWKQKVYPILIEKYGEPENTFILFSIFYHEETAIALLENILYHSDCAESIDDTVIDLIDYAVNYITMLIYSSSTERSENPR